MRDAAQDGMLITVYCPMCRRRVNYWAQDLVKVVGPLHQAHIPPFPCSKCRTRELQVSWRVLPASEIGGLTVRRPVRQITKWIWRDEVM